MHIPHRRHHSYLRMHQSANLGNISLLLGAHLHDEHLMVGLKLLAYGAHHAERSVEIARSHQHIVLLTQQAI